MYILPIESIVIPIGPVPTVLYKSVTTPAGVIFDTVFASLFVVKISPEELMAIPLGPFPTVL